MSAFEIHDMPKLQSPFIRVGNGFIVTPDISPGYEWVFTDPTVRAVDKIDGTNVSVWVEDGRITRIFNRKNEWKILSIKQTTTEGACLEGLGAAIRRGWLKDLKPGLHFGELIGPTINSNRHKIQSHLWVPLSYLYRTCHWTSWLKGMYPKTFDSISEWFKDLPSLFNERMGLPEIKAEGLVFTSSDGRMAKLRRDMFDFYVGTRHKEIPS
jgi:hypothetical protein